MRAKKVTWGPSGPSGGICPGCKKETGGLKYHMRYCLFVDHSALESLAESLTERAASSAAAETGLRPAQRFQSGVTDLDVSRVMIALERGVRPYRNRAGHWLAPTGTALEGMGSTGVGRNLSTVVNEMVRTGLVRHYRDREGDHLLPAPVHFRIVEADSSRHSACRFTGEDMGPMRARLIDRMDLVDCLACEAVVSISAPRGL